MHIGDRVSAPQSNQQSDPLGKTTPFFQRSPDGGDPVLMDCPSAGAVVDGYCLDTCLGQGGMGQVWRGIHTGLDRLVAVKFLRSDLLDNEDAQARFLREIRVAAAIRHPRVVTIWHSGRWGQWLFLVQEFMPGGDAAALLRRRGALAIPEAVGLINDCAHGLAAIHEAGFLHRDLKPQNLLIDAVGHGQVADFGLAVALHGETNRLTRPGSSPGTPAFMSAEQLRDQPLDTRADVYAWGATAFVLLTGRVPYPATDAFSLLIAQMQGPLPDPRQLNSAVPDALALLIRRCLAPDPLMRPADGQELVRLLAGQSLPSQPYGIRRRTLISMAVLSGVFLCMLVWWFGRESIAPALRILALKSEAPVVSLKPPSVSVFESSNSDTLPVELPRAVISENLSLGVHSKEPTRQPPLAAGVPPPTSVLSPKTSITSAIKSELVLSGPLASVDTDASPIEPIESAALFVSLCPSEASSDTDALMALARRWSHAAPAASGIALPDVLAADLARRCLGSALRPFASEGRWLVRIDPSLWADRLDQEFSRAPRSMPAEGDATAWKRMATGLTRALIASAVEGQDAVQVLAKAASLPGNRWCDSVNELADLIAADLGGPVRRWVVRDLRTGSTAAWMPLANQLPFTATGSDLLVLADAHPKGVVLLAIALDDQGRIEGASLAGYKERSWQTQESQIRAVAAASRGRGESLNFIAVVGMGSASPSLVLRCHQAGVIRLLAHGRGGCRILGSDRYVSLAERGAELTIALPSNLAVGEVLHGFLAETLSPRRGLQESSQEAIAWLRGSPAPSESWICP